MACKGKEILVRETAGIDRISEYIRVSVPFASGELLPETPVTLIDPASRHMPTQARTLKQWRDGSVKWLLIDSAVTVTAGGAAIYQVVPAPVSPSSPSARLSVSPGDRVWQVDTGAGIFSVDACRFRPFAMVRRGGGGLLIPEESSCFLSLDESSHIEPLIENIRLEESGPLRAIVHIAGRFDLPGKNVLRFTSRLHFFADSMAVQIEFTLRNPQAASHSGGLWDLGDAGSVLFRELAFAWAFPAGTVQEVCCVPKIGAASIKSSEDEYLSVYQESSGGKNWLSPNHRNRHGFVPMTLKGFVMEVGGMVSESGLRASPVVWCGTDNVGIAVAVPHFWQEFPKGIEANKKQLKISLLPARFPDLHELQGGEQKTHLFALDFEASPDSMAWALSPVAVVVSAADYHSSGIFNDLPGTDDLPDQFASGADIIGKRESVDEYGWRNFGEIYADHEAVNHRGNEPFVSHYNNQYDFCAGAYRKFFATGDAHWGELAADLARHCVDIDIYHTDLDREEYNHGLFWHTDHYLDAGLSGHRSYSGEHLKKKDSCFCGGGPGAEHCYTTGLMLHYFQTGDPVFRETVINLAEWVLRSISGPQTILAALKRAVGYILFWRSFRNINKLFPRYPFTRGTGNAVSACLDAFDVGGDRRFLDAAEKLIYGSIHPNDDISARNLLEAETGWSYTVLLVAIAKFVDKKNELEEFDLAFEYGRRCLLTYAAWMLNNEYLYLDKPEKLEYPNETWPAQDLRKSVIFLHASRYAHPEQRSAFIEKGRYFFTAASNELHRHNTSIFTRPLVLMLQNGWAGSRLFDEDSEPAAYYCPDVNISSQPTPYLSLSSVGSRICSEIMQAAQHTNPRREASWLLARLKS